MPSSLDGQTSTRVYLDVAPWDFRARNTDWRYVRHLLPRLIKWQPELDLVLQSSPWITLLSNYKAVRMAVGRRAGFPLALQERETDQLNAQELHRSGCNVVFSHRGYPTNAGDVPVIWQSSVLDPVMTRSYQGGDTPAQLAENELRHQLFHQAAVVQVSTVAEAVRLDKTYPELAGKFTPVPFFLPDLQAVPIDLLERHHSPEKIHLLFVGNEAWRKGLDLLIAAFQQLPNSARRHAHLTIISNFDDRKFAIPTDETITVLHGVPHSAVLAQMRRAHVLINVARFESYGFIFPEAMSQGVACIGPDWEVQRELLDEGRAGTNVACDVTALSAALLQLIEDDTRRYALASAALARFQQRYAPAIVARQYTEMFRAACIAAG
jgi:glycosyltransferase involved in cell wall biosynthesis